MDVICALVTSTNGMASFLRSRRAFASIGTAYPWGVCSLSIARFRQRVKAARVRGVLGCTDVGAGGWRLAGGDAQTGSQSYNVCLLRRVTPAGMLPERRSRHSPGQARLARGLCLQFPVCLSIPEPGVQGITKAVAQKIDAQDCKGDEQTGPEDKPGVQLEKILAVVKQAAPGGKVGRKTQAGTRSAA